MKDKLTGQNVVLSKDDIGLIERFRKGKYVDPNYDYDAVGDFSFVL